MLSNNHAIGQRIAYYRKHKGLHQYELAAMVQIRAERLSRIETGVGPVGIPRLARIAWVLGVSLRELLGLEEEEIFKD